jgi:hypothetical protein
MRERERERKDMLVRSVVLKSVCTFKSAGKLLKYLDLSSPYFSE